MPVTAPSLVTWKVSLTTATCIHIGSSQGVLFPMEFVLFGDPARYYAISEDRLAERLLEMNAVEALSQAIYKGGSAFDLGGFLKSRGLLHSEFLAATSRYSAPIRSNLANRPSQVRPFIRNAFQRPYLPGSSIKGALRTAVFYRHLMNLSDEEFESRFHRGFASRLEEAENPPKGRESFKKTFAQGLEADAFQNYDLGRDRLYGPNKDIFRCLRVSDSAPLDANAAQMGRIEVRSLRQSGYEKKTDVWAEYFAPGASFEFSMSWDQKLFDRFKANNPGRSLPFESMEDVLTAAREFCARQAEWDKGFFEETYAGGETPRAGAFYASDPPNFRLGWGSGLIGTSVLMTLEDSDALKLRDRLFLKRDSQEFPKSRRHPVTLENGQETLSPPMGWARLEVIEKRER